MSIRFHMGNIHDWCESRNIEHFYSIGEDPNTFSGIRMLDGKDHPDNAILSDEPQNKQFRSVLSYGRDKIYFLHLSATETARKLQTMYENYLHLERTLKSISIRRRPLFELLEPGGSALSFPIFIIQSGKVLAYTHRYGTRIHGLFSRFLHGKENPMGISPSLIYQFSVHMEDSVPMLCDSPVDPGEKIILAHMEIQRSILWIAALQDERPLTPEDVFQVRILCQAIRYHLESAEPELLKNHIEIPDRIWNRHKSGYCFSVYRIEPSANEPSLIVHWLYNELRQRRPDDYVYFAGYGLVLISCSKGSSGLPDRDFFSFLLSDHFFLVGKSNLFSSPEDFSLMLQQAYQAVDLARHAGLYYLAIQDVSAKLIRSELQENPAIQSLIHPAVRYLFEADQQQMFSFSCFKTLQSFIFHGGNYHAAAKELEINRNTLVQRISKIEDLTGISFQNPDLQETLVLSFLLFRSR